MKLVQAIFPKVFLDFRNMTRVVQQMFWITTFAAEHAD